MHINILGILRLSEIHFQLHLKDCIIYDMNSWEKKMRQNVSEFCLDICAYFFPGHKNYICLTSEKINIVNQ